MNRRNAGCVRVILADHLKNNKRYAEIALMQIHDDYLFSNIIGLCCRSRAGDMIFMEVAQSCIYEC